MRSSVGRILWLGAWLILATPLVADSAPAASAESDFDRIKALAGTWTGTAGHAGQKGGDATVVYRLTSGGSAVLETHFPGTSHEMVTVYHLDQGDLVLTHYCAMGNQPSMKRVPSTDPGTVVFDFRGGANVEDGGMHMHAATLKFVDADHLESTWTTWDAGQATDASYFSLTRTK